MKPLSPANGVALLLFMMAPAAAAAQKAYSHGSPSAQEQLMLELVNRARANPKAEAKKMGIGLNRGLSPGSISAARKQPLAFNGRLLAAARDHSRWMLNTGIFSHTGLGGSSPSERAAARGFPFGAAENIEQSWSSAPIGLRPQTHAAHASLFRSADHRVNLMDPDHSVAGIGMLFARRGGAHLRRTTQKFAADVTVESGPFIVGVAFIDKNRNRFYDPGEGLRGIRVKPSRGSHFAVTSSSGGFAIPIRPVATRPGVVRVDLPFPANQAGAWQMAEAYDRAFRAAQIDSAPFQRLRLRWSARRRGLPVETILKIKRPELINYRLTGTDGSYFERSMITASSVKADLIFTGVKPKVLVR